MRPAVALGLFLLCGAARADVAVVTSQAAGRLSYVDTATGAVLVGVDLPGQPAAVALGRAMGQGLVATVAVGTKTLHLLDLSGREIARHRFDGAPFGVAFEGERAILVSDAAEGGRLHRLSLPDLQPVALWSAAATPSGLDVGPEGHVVVAARDADLVLIYPPDCAALCQAQRVPVGRHPFGVTVEGGRAYVTNVLSDDLSVIDLASGQEIARLPTGERPYAVAFAAGRGFVSNQYDASLTVFDVERLEVIARVETGDYPEGVAASAEGRILVANWFSDTLQIFEAESLSLIAELAMPEGPRAFGRFVAPAP